MELTIGEIIATDIKKSGLSVTYVAQKIGMSRKGLSDILKRNDMSLSQLASLSEAIGKDYFAIYISKSEYNVPVEYNVEPIELSNAESPNDYQELEEQMTFSINLKGSFNTVANEMSNFLQLIKKEAEDRGLHLV